MDSIESRIGYQFKDRTLLQESLTHPSMAYEKGRPTYDNQRLEYLGDAVIQLVMTTKLYRDFPNQNEGRLTKLRSLLVSRPALFRYAIELDLGSHLRLGRGEERTGGRTRESNLADAFEALVGAIYLDSGLEAATSFIIDNFETTIDSIISQPEQSNPKGDLQEILQAISPSSPKYHIISQEGPDHEKLFVSEVSWEGITLGRGTGASKKESESAAATDALEKKRWKGES